MSRFAVVCSLLVGVFAGCDVFFPGGGGRSGTLTGLGPDGGVCEKDPQTIKNVMLAPPTCNATNPCPCGTFCSSQTGGNCVADCVDDTWCSPGHFCSGYGQCLAGSADGGVADGGNGPNLDPSCPRNEALLDSLHVMRRSCQFDDICPFGSFCDHVQESCDYECRSDAQCAPMNTPGHTFVCGCLGKCAEVAAPRVPATQILPTVEVTPRQYIFPRPSPITAPAWGDSNKRLVSLSVVSTFVTTSGSTITGPNVTIQANPGSGLLVQCPGAASPSAMPCSIVVDPSTFREMNGQYRSDPIQLTLAPSTGAPTATNWDLRLSSDDLTGMPATVNLRYSEQTTTEIAPDFQVVSAPDPSFVGVGVVELMSATGATLPIAVKARAWNGDLVLFDETRQLSPSGKLVLVVPTDGTTAKYQTFINPYLDNDLALQSTFEGVTVQKLVDLQLKRDVGSGAMRGTFSRSVYTDFFLGAGKPLTGTPLGPFSAPLAGTLSLDPVPASVAETCSGPTDCAGGETCDLGFCSALPAHRFNASTTTTLEYQFQHVRMRKWGTHYPAGGFMSDPFGGGQLGLYLPNSSLEQQALRTREGYSLHGPAGVVSGEPLADLYTPSGTLLASNLPQKAIPLLTQADGPFPQTGSYLLQTCLTELARDRVNDQPASFQPDTDAFDTYAECINLGRMVWVLSDRTTFQRGLQGWLDVHSFLMREGLEETRLSESIGGIPPAVSFTQPPALERILGVGESGLGFLIDMSTATPDVFYRNSGATLAAEADYRPAKLAQSCGEDKDCNNGGSVTLKCDTSAQLCRVRTFLELPQHEQPVGVPTKVLEAATSYLNVLEAYLARIARQTYGQPADSSPSSSRQVALARFGTAMRLVFWAEQFAVGLNTQAPCTSNPANSSEVCNAIASRFAAMRDEMNVVRERAMAQAEAIRSRRNPFNIPEDDVPVFFGDPSGDSSQYFASSDYLMTGWALPAVAQAQATLDGARSSWLAQLQAKVQDELNQHNRQQELDQLMSKYGAPIIDACGGVEVKGSFGKIVQLQSMELIPHFASDPQGLDSNTCFIDSSCLGADGVDGKKALQTVINGSYVTANGSLMTTVDDPETQAPVSNAALFVRSEVCKVSYTLNLVDGPFHDNAYGHFVDTICPAENLWLYNHQEPPGPHCTVSRGADNNLYFRAGSGDQVPVAALFGPIKRTDVGPGKFYASATVPSGQGELAYPYYDIRTDKRQKFVSGWGPQVARAVGDIFESNAAERCSQGNVTLAMGGGTVHRMFNDYPRPDRNSFPSQCYRGTLGVQMYEMRTQQLRAKEARHTLLTGQQALDDIYGLCALKDVHFTQIQAATDAYLDMRNVYHVQGAIQDFFSGSFGGAGYEAGSALFGEGGPFAGSFPMFGDHPNRGDEAEKMRFMETKFGLDEALTACWNEFRAKRNSLVSAMDEIAIAKSTLDTQLLRFKEAHRDVRQKLQEGIAVYQREKASPLSSLAHVFWVDEKVEQYKKEFEWSRRLVFLAMRAVEFEFQQSLPFRAQIVAATTPAQLDDVLIGLKQQQAARTINRRRPEEASVVVSVRDDVLAIPDRSGDPPGERNWTPAERFMSRLWDDRYAVRDDDGNYLGQGVPFTLAPTGVLETRCGERLWRATATLQGDGIEASAPGASVLLLKRNTFSSQYCDGKSPRVTTSTGATEPGPKMQVGVVHTSAQLFRPGANVDVSDANKFTAALLYPWFNVRKTDFYKTTYRDGASEELAGRGLYGDYVLLIPKQVLDDGFALDRVEDVLLRLDYLSVDNLSQ